MISKSKLVDSPLKASLLAGERINSPKERRSSPHNPKPIDGSSTKPPSYHNNPKRLLKQSFLRRDNSGHSMISSDSDNISPTDADPKKVISRQSSLRLITPANSSPKAPVKKIRMNKNPTQAELLPSSEPALNVKRNVFDLVKPMQLWIRGLVIFNFRADGKNLPIQTMIQIAPSAIPESIVPSQLLNKKKSLSRKALSNWDSSIRSLTSDPITVDNNSNGQYMNVMVSEPIQLHSSALASPKGSTQRLSQTQLLKSTSPGRRLSVENKRSRRNTVLSSTPELNSHFARAVDSPRISQLAIYMSKPNLPDFKNFENDLGILDSTKFVEDQTRESISRSSFTHNSYGALFKSMSSNLSINVTTGKGKDVKLKNQITQSLIASQLQPKVKQNLVNRTKVTHAMSHLSLQANVMSSSFPITRTSQILFGIYEKAISEVEKYEGTSYISAETHMFQLKVNA